MQVNEFDPSKSVELARAFNTVSTSKWRCWHAQKTEFPTDLVLSLLSDQANPNIIFKRNSENIRTPLTVAAKIGHMEVVQALLHYKAPVDVCNSQRQSPLYLAVCHFRFPIVKVLLDAKADVNLRIRDGETPWKRALGERNFNDDDLLKKMHQAGGSLTTSINDEPALIYLSTNGLEGKVRFLLERGINPNTILGSKRISALHCAAKEGHLSIVHLLLEFHSSIDPLDKYKCTPFISAIERSQEGVALELLKRGADPSLADNKDCTPLSWAIKRGLHNIFGILLSDPRVDVDAREIFGETPFVRALQFKREDFAWRLMKKGADLTSWIGFGPFGQGSTTLHLAAQMGSVVLVTEILSRDKNLLDQANGSGDTPLQLATQNDHQRVIKALLKAGAKSQQAKEGFEQVESADEPT